MNNGKLFKIFRDNLSYFVFRVRQHQIDISKYRTANSLLPNRRHVSRISSANLFDGLITRLGRAAGRGSIKFHLRFSPTPLLQPAARALPPHPTPSTVDVVDSTYAQSGYPSALACYWAVVYFGLIVTSGANDATKGSEEEKKVTGWRVFVGREILLESRASAIELSEKREVQSGSRRNPMY